MASYLKALGLKNYRGIGPEWVLMHDFKDFNFFIGANNSGKSTVLNFVSRHLPVGKQPAGGFDPLEHHGGNGAQISTAIGIKFTDIYEIMKFGQGHNNFENKNKHLKNLLSKIADKNQIIWRIFNLPFQQNSTKSELIGIDAKSIYQHLNDQAWFSLWNEFTGASGGSIFEHWIPQIIEKIASVIERNLPETKLVPAMRRIGENQSHFTDFSGGGLITRLAEIQNPDYNKRNEQIIFEKINGFLRSVTEQIDARIEIPFPRNHILVHMNDRILPLSSLGTGIEQVIMIAAFCTIAENNIVCIEEPEIHLHPLLQRKLIKYLMENTSNQYFIATHSASFIDTPESAIFHVRIEDNKTCITQATLRSERFDICMALGHRASDIIQSNAIIWVEGPSDRVYLNYWLRNMAPNLIEGTHYSIMFYGGRLLSHLSADDEEVTDFIQLRNLNRNVMILIDSDKPSRYSKINATKQRIFDEFSHCGIAWLTKGREIENYLDYKNLQKIVQEIYCRDYFDLISDDPFDHALYYKRKNPKKSVRAAKGIKTDELIETKIDKMKVSKKYTETIAADFTKLDLGDRVKSLVEFIHKANR